VTTLRARAETTASPALSAAVALAAASGAAALIYELVWFQALGLAIGTSALSLGLLLTAFLGGMGIGSWLLARFPDWPLEPLPLFAAIELAIAVTATIVTRAIPLLGALYTDWAGPGLGGVALRLAVAALCLLPPCVLMGATLPALARCVESTRAGVVWLGACYGANTLGAVGGVLLAAFYLLRTHDVYAATTVGAGINAAAAVAALALHRFYKPRAAAPLPRATARDAPVAILLVAALSGFTALAAEVLWTRHLSLLLGGTVYAYALILAVFLTGIGIGGGAGAAAAAYRDARTALGVCQLLLCAALAWGAYLIAAFLPYWPLDVTLPTPDGTAFGLDLVRTALVALPAALASGASLPLAVAAAAGPQRDPRRLVGRIYAANTLGAILGALATTFLFVAWLGSRRTLALAILVAAASSLVALAAGKSRAPRRRAAVLAAAAVALLAAFVPQVPAELVAFGRFLPTRGLDANVIYVGEGVTASVAVSEEPSGLLTYHNAGKTQASTYPQDLRLQRMLGHLTTLLTDRPANVLVIGLGAGITAGAVSIDPGVERVVVAEIEPLAAKVAREYFAEANFGVVDNDKVRVAHDDGRHVLATARMKFDAITSDPLDPWVKGAAGLYTREFWELCRAHLTEGGVVTAFLQLYESNEASVKSSVATFFDAFPNGALFANTVDGFGYDAVLVGRMSDAPIDLTAMTRKLGGRGYHRVVSSLRDVGFYSALDLVATYAANAADLEAWLANSERNTDRDLRLQYLAGRALNTNRAPELYRTLVGDGPHFPRGLFAGTPAELETLRQRLAARRNRQ